MINWIVCIVMCAAAAWSAHLGNAWLTLAFMAACVFAVAEKVSSWHV